MSDPYFDLARHADCGTRETWKHLIEEKLGFRLVPVERDGKTTSDPYLDLAKEIWWEREDIVRICKTLNIKIVPVELTDEEKERLS